MRPKGPRLIPGIRIFDHWTQARAATRAATRVPDPPLSGTSLNTLTGSDRPGLIVEPGRRHPGESRPPHARRRSRRRWTALRKRIAAADFLAGVVGGLAAGWAAGLPWWPEHALLLLGMGLGWPLLTFAAGLYPTDSLRSWVSGIPETGRLLLTGLLGGFVILAISSALVDHRQFVLAGVAAATTIVTTGFYRAVARAQVHRDPVLRQRTVIIGSGVVAGHVARKLHTHSEFGLDPIGLLDDDIHDIGTPDLPRLGTIEDLADVLDLLDVDRVIIAFSRAHHDKLLECVRACLEAGVVIDVVPRLFEFLDGAPALDQIGGLPLITVAVPGLSRSSEIAKRGLDIILSAILIVGFAPLLLAVAIAIKLDSRGPILFRQARAGRRGAIFPLAKFRSMRIDADQRKSELVEVNESEDGVMFKIRHDPRVTRTGRLLRRFSLDELPQLFNVLRGDMSLVGPRPLILPETAALDDWQLKRLDLRPGLTGPWQIQGRSEVPFHEMVRFDYQYVVGWSLLRDVEILLATVPAVLAGRGAY
jgi:exopolysaccharide biosynthesis polyprenyl glycosylphosphotransferase